MLKSLFGTDKFPREEEHKEGELYKTVNAFGKTFELRYGFYEERDRQNPLCKPVPIYPDFLKDPLYTDAGEPFATVMQDACHHYKGEEKRTPNTTCAECEHFQNGEEWFGICGCPKNKKPSTFTKG